MGKRGYEFHYESIICDITKSSLTVPHTKLIVFEHHVCVKGLSIMETCMLSSMPNYSFRFQSFKITANFCV